MQFDGVAVPAKATEAPWTAVEGTVAVQFSVHVEDGVTVMEPVRVQVTLPMEVVSVQLKVPAEA